MQATHGVTDREWERVRSVLPPPTAVGSPRKIDRRALVSAIVYKFRHGKTWRELPSDLPNWNTVYSYYRSWRNSGLLSRIARELDLDLHTYARAA